LLRVKRLVGTILIAGAVAIGLLSLRSVVGARAQAEATVRAEATRQAAHRQAELRALEGKVQAAAALRALNAALAARVDRATILDLLDNEDWWRPYREEFPLVRLIVGDALVATRGTAAGANVEAEVVKTARRETVASTQATIGIEPFLLGAARLTALTEADAVLVLGRRATPAVAAPAPQPAERTPLPWAVAGGIALVGVGLLFSGRRAAARPAGRAGAAPAPVDADADATVIPIVHETTLKFGEPRQTYDDFGPANGVAAAPAPAPTYVIVAPTAGPPAVFGRYRLIERLSEGGMSELFVAQTTGIEGFTRSFVLKRLRPELARDKDAVAQFIDEARLQADLVHSNIVPVFDFGVVAGEYFMTQEYIVGRDLGRLMERLARRGGAGLPSPVAYYAAHETLQALSYAHSRRGHGGTPLWIVHRDVAAGNVLVSLAGEVKLSDFGIVKSNDRVSRTQVGMVKGNANFMSPEQARGQAVDARSDLFSLGLVLYYCLSGELLYRGTNDLEVLHHAAGGLLLEDLERVERLPDPAPQILARALALDPSERFQTASEFADTMAIHMGGGRMGAARLMRELFSGEIPQENQQSA
jgi:eukaryotic-like serine/threonine-protein kinase